VLEEGRSIAPHEDSGKKAAPIVHLPVRQLGRSIFWSWPGSLALFGFQSERGNHQAE
jgi:hypothetical protein